MVLLRRPKVSKEEPVFTILDVETTGVTPQDRIVEIALVRTDANGEIVDTFESLINPERDVGPTGLHGVSASMVSAAPTFAEVGGAVAGRIDGTILVAHNLRFDSQKLDLEFTRMGAEFEPGEGLCTLRATRSRLDVACAEFEVEHGAAHCALDDALAAAGLLFECGAVESDAPRSNASIRGAGSAGPLRTLSREAVGGGAEISPLVEAARLALLPPGDESVLVYAEALDRVLLDAVLSREEAALLGGLAREMGLADADTDAIHHAYFVNLLAAVMRDGVVTREENDLLLKIVDALALDVEVPEPTGPSSSGFVLVPGMKVCFTGEGVDEDGEAIPRPELETHAQALGLECVGSVTKKNCDLLVAGDPASMSGKAKKARQYEKPVISASEFLKLS